MSELKRSSNEEPLKDIVNRWLKAYGLESKMKEMEVIEAWPEIMGKAVAHRTTSISIKNKTLILRLDSSVMREELMAGKSLIISHVNEYAGFELINDVWFG